MFSIKGPSPEYVVRVLANRAGKLSELFGLRLEFADEGGIFVQAPLAITSEFNIGPEVSVHDAIAKKLNEKGKLSRNAIAESIINNVRKTIIRDQLTDPRFYTEMSKLLDDLIQQKRQETKDYEKFLERAEALVKQLGKKISADGVPAVLHGKPEATVIYNNLPTILAEGSAVVREDSPLDLQERAALWASILLVLIF